MSFQNKQFDLILAVLLLTVALFGLLILYSASAILASRWTGQADFYFWKQLGWYGIGMLLLLIASVFPLKLLRKLALPAMLISIVILLLVFVPGVGHSVSSSRDAFRRWLKIGPIIFQPSEFSKIALILYVATLIASQDILNIEFDLKRFSFPVILVGIQLIAVVMEPQYGTTLCLLGVIVLMAFVAGFPILRLAMVFFALIPLLVILVVFWEYRFERVYVWMDPYKYRYTGGYQLVTSFRAFMEGGWFGTNIASGFAHKYLTYGHTDFVLSLYAEDYGFVGVLILLLLYAAILWRSWFLIKRIEEKFPFMLGAGIIIMLFLQIVLNISVVTGLVPTTGVSLPFVSYGGSSLIVTLIFSGLLLNVTRKNTTSQENAADVPT